MRNYFIDWIAKKSEDIINPEIVYFSDLILWNLNQET